MTKSEKNHETEIIILNSHDHKPLSSFWQWIRTWKYWAGLMLSSSCIILCLPVVRKELRCKIHYATHMGWVQIVLLFGGSGPVQHECLWLTPSFRVSCLVGPRLAPVIGALTHSKCVLAESCYAVPHLILTATQRYQWHVTVTRVRHRTVHPCLLESVLRPHVAVVL